jgi:hypothetical protein
LETNSIGLGAAERSALGHRPWAPAREPNRFFDRAQEEKLAWDMLEFHRSCVRFRRRTPIFVLLGGGDFEAAIEAVLTDIAETRKVLPRGLRHRADAWVAAYQGHSEYQSRQTLIARCCQ